MYMEKCMCGGEEGKREGATQYTGNDKEHLSDKNWGKELQQVKTDYLWNLEKINLHHSRAYEPRKKRYNNLFNKSELSKPSKIL